VTGEGPPVGAGTKGNDGRRGISRDWIAHKELFQAPRSSP
jgi:hypothetical protein